MKLNEIHRSGVTDNEDLGEHARTAAVLNFNVSFAHESGLSELFAQLLTNGAFQTQLEVGFAKLLQQQVSQLVRTTQVPPGDGWTDDYEVEVSVNPVDNNTL